MGRSLRPTLFDLGGAVDEVPKLGSSPMSPLKDFLHAVGHITHDIKRIIKPRGRCKNLPSVDGLSIATVLEQGGVGVQELWGQRWPSSFVSRRGVTDGSSWFQRQGSYNGEAPFIDSSSLDLPSFHAL